MFLNLLFVIFISMFSFNAFSLSGENFEFHGYLRTGVGTNSKGGDQTCFNNPGAGSNEFRLGNECSTYGEMTFIGHHLKAKKANDSFFKTTVTLGYSTNGDTNWENLNGGNGFQLREAFIEGGNVDDSPLTYWAGNRFYRDNDVYMNDFYYFADASANGGGLGNIPLGKSKLALAFLKQTSSDDTDNGKVSLTLLDARLNDIKITDKVSLKLWFGHAWTSEGIATADGKSLGDQSGQVAGALFSRGLDGGFNHFAMIYGRGVMEDIHISFSPLEQGTNDHEYEKNKKRIRLVDHLTYRVSKKIGLHASATYELRDNGEETNNKEVWYNVGVQPVYFFTEHKQIAAVLGYSSVDKDGVEDRRLFRFTIAPQIALSNNVWARPVIRAFYTKTFWSRSNRGSIGSSAYSGETSGSNFGIQAEVFY